MRREFSTGVKIEIIKRAARGRLDSVSKFVRCEACEALCGNKFQIDHRDPDALQVDKSRRLTAADGWLLCIPCHKEKTKDDVADIARAKRREAAHLGARRPKQPIKGGGSLKGPERAHEKRTALPPKELYR